jgi:hypothetical protein
MYKRSEDLARSLLKRVFAEASGIAIAAVTDGWYHKDIPNASVNGRYPTIEKRMLNMLPNNAGCIPPTHAVYCSEHLLLYSNGKDWYAVWYRSRDAVYGIISSQGE